MATGPEHYQEAERLLAKATYEDLPTNAHIQDAQLAQAHATLALAAATAANVVLELPIDSDIGKPWARAIGLPGGAE